MSHVFIIGLGMICFQKYPDRGVRDMALPRRCQPVNTSGGLECRGHPIGASVLAQIYELGLQLRGEAGRQQVENASIGLAEWPGFCPKKSSTVS